MHPKSSLKSFKSILYLLLLLVIVAYISPIPSFGQPLSDGPLVVNAGQVFYVDSIKTKASSSFNSGQNNIPVQAVTGFQIGQTILIIQVDGQGAGAWEKNTIESIQDNILVASNALQNNYLGSGTQILKVPQYTSVYVKGGGRIACEQYSNGKGGIIAFSAASNVRVDGLISADTCGYSGGLGGTAGTGGAGSTSHTIFGSPGTPGGYGSTGMGPSSGNNGTTQSLTLLQMGSGGNGGNGSEGGTGGTAGSAGSYTCVAHPGYNGSSGSNGSIGGSGGKGGGIILIQAQVIYGKGQITALGANGIRGATGGKGGNGGAGGSGGYDMCNPPSTTSTCGSGGNGGNGGDGGNAGNGGNGGAGGTIVVQATFNNFNGTLISSGGSLGANATGGSGGLAGSAGGKFALCTMGYSAGSPGSAGSAGLNSVAGLSGSNGFLSIPSIVLPAIPILVLPVQNDSIVQKVITTCWTSIINADAYHFQLSNDSLFASLVYDTVLTDTSIQVHPNLGKKQFWRVKSQNSIGSSAWSEIRCFTTIVIAPFAPIPYSPLNNSVNIPTSARLVWKKDTNAINYQMQISPLLDFTNILKDSSFIADTFYSLSSLLNNTLYYWRINATNTGGTSSWSLPWSFTTIVSLPSAVTLVAPMDTATIAADSVLLKWSKCGPVVTKYQCEVATNSGMTSLFLSDSSIVDTIKWAKRLTNHQIFWWHVRAYNVAGWGPYSASRKFTSNFTVTSVLPRDFKVRTNGLSKANGVLF